MTKTLISWDDDLGVTHVVKCDAIVSFRDTRESEITQHSIENGSEITDHIIHKPPSLTVEVHQSNEPAEPDKDYSREPLDLEVVENNFKPQGLFLIHSAAGALVGSILGKKKQGKPYILQPDTESDRILELHDKLIDAWQNGYSISLDQYGRSYADYVLSFVEYTREGNGKGGLGLFRLELVTVRTVSTATTELPDPADLHAKPQTDRGNKPGQSSDADPSEVVKSGSLAYEAIFGGGIGGAF